MVKNSPYSVMSAEEAAGFVKHGDTLAFSGFSPAGSAKVVPTALAEYVQEIHGRGKPFKLRVLTGASSGCSIDHLLAQAGAIEWRAPYQAETFLRHQINNEKVEYVDMHLSHLPQAVSFGFFGKIDLAVIEATEITPDGRVYLTSSIGASPTYLKYADKVIIELNRSQSPRLREFADIVMMPSPPNRSPVPIFEPCSRIGWPYATVDPQKVIAVVESNEPDYVADFSPPDAISRKIADHVVRFLFKEKQANRIPPGFLPMQAGVGNIANGVLAVLGEDTDIPSFTMYSEVFQDAMVDLMLAGKLTGASATSLTVSSKRMQAIYDDFDFFASRIVLRPQEISNHPGVIRRLGVIAMNTVIEADIYGNANSSHICGMDVMNGVGGSGDFTRNSYLSILMTPSIAKNGRISAIVPMCPHIDNNEHSVQVIVTEQGLADLRGLGPAQRAREMINQCAHPMYREYLERYVIESRGGHIRHDLARCFELHRNLMEYGSMLPETAIG